MFQFAFAPNSNRPVERTNALPSSKRLATLALPDLGDERIGEDGLELAADQDRLNARDLRAPRTGRCSRSGLAGRA